MQELIIKIDVLRYVPKHYFCKQFDLSLSNYANWKNRDHRFKEQYFPLIDTILIDMDSLNLGFNMTHRLTWGKNVLYRNYDGKLRFVERKPKPKDIDINVNQTSLFTDGENVNSSSQNIQE